MNGKVLCAFLALLLIALLPVFQPEARADSAVVQARLNYMLQVYPTGSYFSKNGEACPGDQHDGCYNCQLFNVPARGNLPAGNAVGADASATCVGFAKYAFYCLNDTVWATSSNDNVTVTTNIPYNQVYQKAKLGDYISYSGHAGIFIRGDSSGYYMYESNVTVTNRVVYCGHKHTNGPCKIVHANNYDEADTEKPVVTSASVSSITKNGYSVNCSATDNVNVSSLQIGTWNDVIGVDNAKWQTVAVYGNSVSHTFSVNISDFDNQQNTVYHTNVYAIDAKGNMSASSRAGDVFIETQKPVIKEASITSASPTRYYVRYTATDNSNIAKMMIGTWNDAIGVSNAKWQTVAVSGKEVTRTFCIDIADFDNRQDVVYHTNVYAIDTCGNINDPVSAGTIMLETEKPVITEAAIVSAAANGYSVRFSATDNSNIAKLQIGSWNDDIGVSNAKWQTVEVSGKQVTHTFNVDIADFDNKQNVVYHTNVYAIDSCGNKNDPVSAGYILIENEAPVITDGEVSQSTRNGYQVVVNATDNSALSKLQIGTWHSGITADDALWQECEIDGDGNAASADFYIDYADFGDVHDVTFTTTAFAIDRCGNSTGPVVVAEVFRPDYSAVDNADFILPATLAVIDGEAFSGLAMAAVKCPETLEEIGARAFAGCLNLRNIYIPESVTAIDATAFEDCEGLVIWGRPDSEAEIFADNQGYTFREYMD